MGTKADLQRTWDAMSPYYQKRYGESLMFYEKLHLALFGPLRGKKLLDLGCGGGQTSVFFAKQGAVVTGVDFSEKQLGFAGALAEKKGVAVSFQQENVEDLSAFKDNSFDLANSSHALHYIKDLRRCFAEVFRVLKPGGKFVLSVSHPFNHILSTEGDCLVVKQSYFQKGKYRWKWLYPKEKVEYSIFLFKRRVADYFAGLREAGFIVEDLLEPKTDLDENSPWRNQLGPEEELVPGALIFGARKP